ncbi:MAG: nickel-dependent lactate racemase [Deltaproteobacteria bacterium]|nr:nickel-dependent lactate racemase [Deltaproteobacteria bacterium]MBW2150499.1 nickel-dependent lactate racemase [Deltaproteobacteria bacterium]
MGHAYHTEQIPYGTGELTLKVPEKNYIGTLIPSYCPAVADERAEIVEAIDNPIGTPPLEEIVRQKHGKKTVVVVNDGTRPTATYKLLPPLLEKLERCGISEGDILILIATGTHRAVGPDEIEPLLGKGITNRYRIVNHDCLDLKNMVDLGTTSQGIPIVINRLFCEADIKILTGSIHPHQGAGFSGGRKSILPGLTSLETLKLHHGPRYRPLEPAMGQLDGNPFHLGALEGAKMAAPDFILNLVQNQKKEITRAVAGDLEQAWMKGVEASREIFEARTPHDVDIVIVVPGGHPRDVNLYQSQKSMAAAELVVKRGGSIILPAACPDGIGSELFFKWLASAGSPEDVMQRFQAEGYDVGTSKAWLYARCLLKAEMIIVSEFLEQSVLEQMFTKKAADMDTALKMAFESQGQDARVLIMRNAADMIPVREDGG